MSRERIIVLGNPREPMIVRVHDELERRGRAVEMVRGQDIPYTTSLGLRLGEPDGLLHGFFALADGRRIDLDDVQSIYQRAGFFETEVFEEYNVEESHFANAECQEALNVLLDSIPALVVNRPVFSGSNASKPYQVSLVEDYGFLAPRTLVTNRPEAAAEFFEAMEGRVIYKSVSYVRSIVKVMQREDLDRLPSLRTCPLQLQECVEGTDIRVHVVGDRVFASLISAEQSDYRYDRGAEITAWELPGEIADRCVAVARGLGFVLTGIDLRMTSDGRFYCFEVNPSPAFTWYEDRTEQPIVAALCDVLEAGG